MHVAALFVQPVRHDTKGLATLRRFQLYFAGVHDDKRHGSSVISWFSADTEQSAFRICCDGLCEGVSICEAIKKTMTDVLVPFWK